MISVGTVTRANAWHPHRRLSWWLESASLSVCGAERDHVEDCVIANDESGIYGVADGVGGCYGGAEASGQVCESFINALKETDISAPFTVADAKAAFDRALDQALLLMAKQVRHRMELSKMGTTLAIGWIVEGRLYYAHAGDSRIYLLRKGELVRLTKDHSFLEELRQSGQFSEPELAQHPYRNAILRCIGPASRDSRLDVSSLWLRPHDRLLFLTDGITDVVSDKQIAALAEEVTHRKTLCEVLVKSAQRGGSQDDLSCVVADCDTDEPEHAKLQRGHWWELLWSR